jgi:hypothetical protein
MRTAVRRPSRGASTRGFMGAGYHPQTSIEPTHTERGGTVAYNSVGEGCTLD